MRTLISLIVSAGLALSAWGQCLTPQLEPAGPLNPEVNQALEFEAVEGADRYQVEVLHPNNAVWVVLGTTGNPRFALPSLVLPFDDELRSSPRPAPPRPGKTSASVS